MQRQVEDKEQEEVEDKAKVEGDVTGDTLLASSLSSFTLTQSGFTEYPDACSVMVILWFHRTSDDDI